MLQVFGVSLNKPHTSVTVLHMCVCMVAWLWPHTINLKWAQINISQRSNVHVHVHFSSVESGSVHLLPNEVCSMLLTAGVGQARASGYVRPLHGPHRTCSVTVQSAPLSRGRGAYFAPSPCAVCTNMRQSVLQQLLSSALETTFSPEIILF